MPSCNMQTARARQEAPRFIAGALKDDSVVSGIPGVQRRDFKGEVLPAKGPARAPWPTLRLQVSKVLLLSLVGARRLGTQLLPDQDQDSWCCFRVILSATVAIA